MSPAPVIVTSYNMHKGMSALDRKVQLNSTADILHDLRSNAFFLQEIRGRYQMRDSKIDGFPEQPRYGLLSERLSHNRSYSKNAVYPQRHHGNTISSCLPTKTLRNLDVTVNRLEQCGTLHREVLPEGWEASLVCPHARLSLHELDHTKQYRAIFEYVDMHVNPASPLATAGDFNDWCEKSALSLEEVLNLDEVFADDNGRRPRAFPSCMPLSSLDRVYTRNLETLDAQIHNSKHWQYLSNYLPLSVEVRPKLKLSRQAV